MNAKVNFRVELRLQKIITAELWDVDPLMDDKIDFKKITESGQYEFIFSTSETGEFKPELQLRFIDESGKEIYKTPINNSISDFGINKTTGFNETSNIDFGLIII